MDVSRRSAVFGLLAIVLAGGGTRIALADRKQRGRDGANDEGDHEDDHDHEAAAQARAAGEIRPLADIIRHVSQTHPGEIVGIELERDGGRWLYEIKLVTPDNRFLELYVDARDMQVLKVEGK